MICFEFFSYMKFDFQEFFLFFFFSEEQEYVHLIQSKIIFDLRPQSIIMSLSLRMSFIFIQSTTIAEENMIIAKKTYVSLTLKEEK